MEMGYNQKDAVTALAGADGHYDAIYVRKDYGGHDRVICMRRKALGRKP
jgi:methylase of polypeptide subunit release factors